MKDFPNCNSVSQKFYIHFREYPTLELLWTGYPDIYFSEISFISPILCIHVFDNKIFRKEFSKMRILYCYIGKGFQNHRFFFAHRRTLATGKKSSSYAAKDFKRSHVKGLFLELCLARSLNQKNLIQHLNQGSTFWNERSNDWLRSLLFLIFFRSDLLIPDLNETTDIIDGLVGGFLSVFKPKYVSDIFNIEFDPFKKPDIRGYEVGFQIGSRKIAFLI